MRKILALLLFATFSASAADIAPTAMPSLTEWARSEWKQYNGILYLRVPIAGGRWCFSRSTAGIAAKSSEWEYVAPQVVVTIPASLEQIQVCTDTLPLGSVSVVPPVVLNPLIEYRYSGAPVRNADGSIKRSSSVIAAYRKVHPCPSTGLRTGACPNWALNHVVPLACGGYDAVSNLVWMRLDAKKIVDGYERKMSAATPPYPDTAACVNVVMP